MLPALTMAAVRGRIIVILTLRRLVTVLGAELFGLLLIRIPLRQALSVCGLEMMAVWA